MESTDVFWIPLFRILEDRGLEVCLVNARHVKNVPGRKTDVLDCQWLQYLHSVGLLHASFRPRQVVCALRALLRHKDSLVQMSSQHIQHVQKALSQMNVQLHHVISDITGATGLAILDAILSGERNPGQAERPPHQGVRRNRGQVAGRRLPVGAPVHVAAVLGRLSPLPATDWRMRPRDRAAVGRLRVPGGATSQGPEEIDSATRNRGESGARALAHLRGRRNSRSGHQFADRSGPAGGGWSGLVEVPQRIGLRILVGTVSA